MKQRLLYFFSAYFYWLVIFVLFRLAFMLFLYEQSFNLTFFQWVGVFYHGMRLDLAAGSYMLLFPALLLVLAAFTRTSVVRPILDVYMFIVLFIVVMATIIDMELYPYWGFRLDATPLLYADHPKEMLASVSIWVIIRQLLIGAVFMFFSVWLYRKTVRRALLENHRAGLLSIPVFLILAGLLVIPARGGTGVATNSPGSVYFSKIPFANQAAVNLVFNLGYALTNLESVKDPYAFEDEQKAENIVKNLYEDKGTFPQVIHSKNPNIIIILLESFTAKAIEPLGGRPGVTPNFTRLSKEGILFTNMYSSGNRSDRGIVSVLSGFPSLPDLSIIKYPQKTQRMPFLSRVFKERGYHSSFYHGGDIDFANTRSFITNGGFDRIVSKNDFDRTECNSKWGAHDQYVLERMFNDLNKEKQPFFSEIFTLTSHEPYEVPVKTPFQGKDDDTKFMGSLWYADSCLGDFIEKARKTDWWKNTLVILVADHGTRIPGNDDIEYPIRYHIPMLWIGGALTCKDTVVGKISNQTDIASTLLAQLGINAGSFLFSKNILSSGSKSFTYFFYNDGFGYIDDKERFSYDNKSRSVTISEGVVTDQSVLTGRSYLQVLYNTFMKY